MAQLNPPIYAAPDADTTRAQHAQLAEILGPDDAQRAITRCGREWKRQFAGHPLWANLTRDERFALALQTALTAPGVMGFAITREATR